MPLHSAPGVQCASQAYFKLTQTYGIAPSMSRREDPYDNAMMGDLSYIILKTECIYRYKPATFSEAMRLLTDIFTPATVTASS